MSYDVMYSEMKARREALWNRLPVFDLKAALAGHPYVFIFDLPDRKVAYHDIRPIKAPHEGYMLWVGEWVIYEGDAGFESMCEMFRMCDPSVLGTVEVIN